jgi:hypothetical protein
VAKRYVLKAETAAKMIWYTSLDAIAVRGLLSVGSAQEVQKKLRKMIEKERMVSQSTSSVIV